MENNMEKEIIRYSYIHGISVAEEDVPNSFHSHWHDSAEFIITLKNGVTYKINDETYSAAKGDVLFVWPREIHEIIAAPDDSYILLQFSSNLIENNTDIATAIRFLSKCHHISREKEPKLVQQVSDYLYELRDIYHSSQYFVETKCKIKVYNILLLLGEYIMQEHREIIGNEKFSDTAWGYVRSACNYIAEHSDEDISQSEVANAIGISAFYFSKLFKEYMHMTFPAYLSNLRVQKAINLLANERISITDCAFEAGFQSTTTFNKIFRETTGYTPKDFRKLHTKN